MSFRNILDFYDNEWLALHPVSNVKGRPSLFIHYMHSHAASLGSRLLSPKPEDAAHRDGKGPR
jgi:hypothetical protein